MTLSYMITSAFLLIILGIIFVNVNSKLKGSPHRFITGVVIFTTFLYVVVDCVRTYFCSFDQYYKNAFVVTNFCFYLIYITLPYFWFIFSNHFIFGQRSKRIYDYISLTPWVLNLFLILLSLFSDNYVWVIGDASNRYVRGPLFNIFSNINLIYYAFPVLEILVIRILKKNCDDKTLWSTFLFSIGPAVGYCLSTFLIPEEYQYPFLPFFFVVGVMFSYTYLISSLYQKINEEKEMNLRQKELKEIELQEAKQKAEQNSIISSLAEGYSFVGIMDISDDKLTMVHSSERAYGYFGKISYEGTDYVALRDRLSKIVHPSELDFFLKETEKEYLIPKIKKEHYHTIDTRFLLGEKDYFFRIKFTYNDFAEDKIVVAVLNNDAQIRREMEKSKIEGYQRAQNFADAFLHSYVSAYYVDLIDFSYIVFHRSEYLQNKYGNLDNFHESIMEYIRRDVHKDDREEMFRAVKPAYIRERLEKEEFYSVYIRDISGEKMRWYRFDVMRGADINHAGISFTDVTEKIESDRKYNEKLEAARALADASSKAKTLFLFNMSHDIRTPMNAISGFTNMAKKNVNDPVKTMDCLEKIDLSCNQLLSLINQVLEMSRIESGKVELIKKTIDISSNFRTVVTVVESQAREKNISFDAKLLNINHNCVISDETKISQIMLNILGNALKYTNPGGSISYSLCETESEKEDYASYKFVVSDTGIGIDEEFLKRIYEPFSREKNSTVSKIQGTGLGMSIVKQLVDLLDGTINVKSEKGVGTVFEVELSLKICDEIEENKKVSKNYDENILKGKKVLLVEDNELNREIAEDILSGKGLSVDGAEDGSVAVEKFKKMLEDKDYGRYDFILMDVQMPKMNGFEATEKIRELEKNVEIHIPIIAMTANAFEEDRQKSLEAGMDEHLSKPVNPAKLIETLSNYID